MRGDSVARLLSVFMSGFRQKQNLKIHSLKQITGFTVNQEPEKQNHYGRCYVAACNQGLAKLLWAVLANGHQASLLQAI